jgi:hypothetical protein
MPKSDINRQTRATGIDGHPNRFSTDEANGTLHAESTDVDTLESHADLGENHEGVSSTASRMVVVTPSDSIWRVTDTASRQILRWLALDSLD